MFVGDSEIYLIGLQFLFPLEVWVVWCCNVECKSWVHFKYGKL